MKIRVKLFATFVQYRPGERAGSPFEVNLPEGATLTDLIASLGIPLAAVKVCFVNARAQDVDFILSDGDEVGIFPPVGGGYY
ncbi:MAG: MoaD/ThiS family protein [Chloroflexota bacterium]|jgi:molybdopterin converting factor small subunit